VCTWNIDVLRILEDVDDERSKEVRFEHNWQAYKTILQLYIQYCIKGPVCFDAILIKSRQLKKHLAIFKNVFKIFDKKLAQSSWYFKMQTVKCTNITT